MNASNVTVWARMAGSYEIEENPQHELPNASYYSIMLDNSTTPPTIVKSHRCDAMPLFFGLANGPLPENAPRLVIDEIGDIVELISGKIIFKGPVP